MAPRTIDNGIANFPEFGDAVRRGRVVADAKAWRAVYECAIGYRYTVERTVLRRGQVRTLTRTVQCPPNKRAAMIWLRNRARKNGNASPASTPDKAVEAAGPLREPAAAEQQAPEQPEAPAVGDPRAPEVQAPEASGEAAGEKSVKPSPRAGSAAVDAVESCTVPDDSGPERQDARPAHGHGG